MQHKMIGLYRKMDTERHIIFSGCLMMALMSVTVSLDEPPDGATVQQSHNQAYFNASLNSQIVLTHTLSLQNHISLSFRTCSQGVLISQTGASGDAIELSLTENGSLRFLWKYQGVEEYILIGQDSLSNNVWYTVDSTFLLGKILLKIEQGPNLKYEEMISNSTFRRFLWDLDTSGGAGVIVGSQFTGCIIQGPSVELSAADVVATNVEWGVCPLETSSVGCGTVAVNPCWMYPCSNGGTCLPNGATFTCNCPNPFTGPTCDIDTGDSSCDLFPCENEGTCIPQDTGTRRYRCECLDGYTGVNCQININECGSSPCKNGGQCSDLINSFLCNCNATGYDGEFCESNIDECVTLQPCFGDATCMDTPGSYKCTCSSNFAGKNCDIEINQCESSPCQAGGTCEEEDGGYKCSCMMGYSGMNCETDIDECVGVTCEQSFTECVDGVNQYTCQCKAGFTGDADNCVDVDECSSSPCLNGATCGDKENYFECYCPPGYTGVSCESELDECQSQPCQNGATCHDGMAEYTCDCVVGFTDANCSTNINDCESNPCLNGAQCVDMVAMYECDCLPGWSGIHCEADILECASNPCQHGATCQELTAGYSCTCVLGYSGDQCETDIDDCAATQCQNGGTCVDEVNGYHCNCPDSWMGDICDQVYDACSFTPCQNGATCVSTPPNREYTCMCIDGFTGVDCETNIDDCIGHSCESYEVCLDGINDFTCQCPLGFSGDMCDEDIDECEPEPCQNGATCHNEVGQYRCECAGAWANLTEYTGDLASTHWTGYEGVNCEVAINECELSPSICLNNGRCEDLSEGYECLCKSQNGIYFTGLNCQFSLEYCLITDDDPTCYNGGTCISGADSYTCDCAPGYTGSRCTVNINECESDPCQLNGTCLDGVNGYICECIPGIEGADCEVNVDECESSPCLNEGQCMDAINEYWCNCSDTGFTGVLCEINIQECDSNPCMHGSNCTDGIKEYTCGCYEAYTGLNCEVDIDECDSSPCHNAATCLQRSEPSRPGFSYETAHGYDCQCVLGFTGVLCETNINECESNPCVFGDCVDQVNSYTCECHPGYKGTHCETEINECDSQPCQYGSSCVDRIADFSCICPPQFEGKKYGGKQCNVELTGCYVNECKNGATCLPYLENEALDIHKYNCTCMPGFTGSLCEDVTTVSLTGSSWIKYMPTDGHNITSLYVSLSFRTTLADGVLMINTLQDEADGQYMMLLLHDALYVSVEYMVGGVKRTVDVMTTHNVSLNDAEWHHVEVSLDMNDELVLSLTHDDCMGICHTMDPQAFADLSTFPMGPTFFGGEDLTQVADAKSFIGCLQDIQVRGDWIITRTLDETTSGNVSEGCPRTEQCSPDPCNSNGHCTDLWFTFSCLCWRPFLGATCQLEMVAATFGYHDNISAANFPILDPLKSELSNQVNLSLFFRTRKTEGPIFYLGGDETSSPLSLTYIMAYLKDGGLQVVAKVSDRAQVYQADLVGNLADGEQHFIELLRSGGNMDVRVDKKSSIKANNLAVTLEFTPTKIEFGRLSLAEELPASVVQWPSIDIPYEGTVQDVLLEGQSLQFYPQTGPDYPQPYGLGTLTNVMPGEVSDDVCLLTDPCVNNGTCSNVFFNDFSCECPLGFKGKNCSALNYCLNRECPGNATCNDLRDGYECVISATFNGDSSMLSYDNTLVTSMPSLDIAMEIRTRKGNGNIMYIQGGNQFITISLINNGLQLLHNLNEDGNKSIPPFSYRILDGGWHKLLVSFSSELYISVEKQGSSDSYSYRGSLKNDLSQILSNSSVVYLGGVDQAFVSSHQDQFLTEEFYKGCINEVRIGDVLLPFFPESELKNRTSAERFVVKQMSDITTGCQGDSVCVPTPCQNGAECEDIFNDYLCLCSVGFNGTDCEVNIDDCVSHECQYGATCVDGIANYTCSCMPGYTDTWCQTDVDDCATEPCFNNATCVDEVDGFWCNCSANFTGDFCEISITDNCDNAPCENNGTCVPLNETSPGMISFNCSCVPGYTGLRCEDEINYCEDEPCENGATCESITEQQTHVCACVDGYTGQNCETEIDECDSVPCQNGATCIDLVADFECQCPDGWDGELCDQDINECNITAELCQNGGQCINEDGGYTCNCTGTGYTGDTCEEEINECEVDNPCLNNATCHNTNGSYVCNCDLGYEGDNCEVANCSYNQCLQGSTCLVEDDQWRCECLEFYEGKQCEIVGPCVEVPCDNGGTCTQEGQEYQCQCPEGWNGQNCTEDIDECISEPCLNNATCSNFDGGYNCTCAAGFTGFNCETDINDCDSDPCQNGGVCRDEVAFYVCDCDGTGFEGVNCEENIDECQADEPVCQNGGVCEDLIGSFQCHCLDAYLGDTCHSLNPCNDTNYCDNGNCSVTEVNDQNETVTVNCLCEDRWTGEHCETALDVDDEGEDNLALVIGLVVAFAFLLIITIVIVAFLIMARNKRATRGTYSPSRQEMSGSRVEMANTLKPPPEERLI